MAEACSRALGKDRELYLAGTSKEGWKSIKRKGWTGNWKGNSLVRARRPNQGQAAASLLRLLRVEVFKALCCFLEIVCQSLTWEKLAPSPKKVYFRNPLTNLILRGKLWLRNRSGHDSPAAGGNRVFRSGCLLKQAVLQPSWAHLSFVKGISTNGTKVQSVALQRTYGMKWMCGFDTIMPGRMNGWHMSFSNSLR